jgi:hypothetical protein
LAGLGGEGGGVGDCKVARCWRWWSGRHPPPRANHMATSVVAMIFGQQGGPKSTSKTEAL